MTDDPTPHASRYADVLLDAVLDGAGLRGTQDLLELLAEKAVELIGCDMGAVRIPDTAGDTLRVAAVSGIEGIPAYHAVTMRHEVIDLSDIRSSTVQPGPRSPSAEAFLRGEVQVVADILGAATSGFTMRSMTAVPLIHAGHARGVLTLYWRRHHVPDPQELGDLALIGRRLALAIDIADHADTLQRRNDDLADRLDQQTVQGDDLRSALRITEGAVSAMTGDDPDPLQSVLTLLTDETGGSFRVLAGREASAGDPRGWSMPLGTDPADPTLISDLLTAPAPVVALAMKGATTAATERASRMLADDAAAASAALARLCREGPEAAAQDAAAALGLLRDSPAVLVVAECRDENAAYRAARTLVRLRFSDAVIAVVDLDARVVALCRADEAAAAHIGARLLALDGVTGVGIGEPFADWRELRTTLERARSAAHLSIARGTPVLAADVRDLADVAAALDPGEAARLVAQTLGLLRAYDATHRTDLLTTLRVFLDTGGNPVAAGRQLHVHPNTVKQRIERIERILGSSLRDFRVIARVSLALAWHDLLRA